MINLDIHKAFDSVHWGFLQELLVHLKLPPHFIKLVMTCVQSVSFDLHVNGMMGGAFPGGRGLKQGDPLSPLLSVLVMEYFSHLMIHASAQDGFRYHPYCKKLQLTHLIFADDVLLFSEAHEPTLRAVKTALDAFHASSGL